MHNWWEKLYVSLLSQIDTKQSHKNFHKLRRRYQELVRFDDPAELKEYLNFNGGDLDEKDGIYSVLIQEVQKRSAESELSTSLLWLGLWPGLAAVYRRQLKYFARQPECLVSDIGYHFTTTIHRANLSRINRVAATLVRNVERDIIASKRKRWKYETRKKESKQNNYTQIASQHRAPAEPTKLDLTPGLSTPGQVAEIEKQLGGIVGSDASLVVAAAVCGNSHRELSEQLGITHEATRKRYQRAVIQIREHFEKKFGKSLSGFVPEERISSLDQTA